MVAVTNLPSRPAPVLARTLTSLSALSGGRVILGIGAGAIWDMIVKLGIPRLGGGAAVRAMGEAITLVRALSGGGDLVTFDGASTRIKPADRALIDQAAAAQGKKRSEFMLEASRRAAEEMLLYCVVERQYLR